MNRIGIRELKQNASAVIRLVRSGQTIEVTEHRRPVARIVPLRGKGPLDQLVAEDRATAAHGNLLEVQPQAMPAYVPLLSEVLADLRADER